MKKDEIKDLMDYFAKKDISKMKIKEGDFEIELEKSSKVVTQIAQQEIIAPLNVAQPGPVVQVANETKALLPKDSLKSPMVGTFYLSPSPGAQPFIKVGQTIRKGEVIGIIEAMKIMNDIEADFDCRIVEILVADGQPVEFDMPLIAVEKI